MRDNFDDMFDRQVNRISKLAIVGTIVSFVLTIGVICGIAFVVYKVLTHFGIL